MGVPHLLRDKVCPVIASSLLYAGINHIYLKMKGLSAKKGPVPPSKDLSEQYRSEASRVSAASLNRDKFSAQNMKEFKCEIDHEIAKCLDTLDRQGLKFLKETLRASKLFALNTQELNNPHIEESIASEESSPEKKAQPKKGELTKNIQIKKVSKPEPIRKPVTAQKSRPSDSKNDLGQKIQKRLESLNIKTGKKAEPRSQQPSGGKQGPNKPKSSQEIEEEIEGEQDLEEGVEEQEIEEGVPAEHKMGESVSVEIEEEIKKSWVVPENIDGLIQESSVKEHLVKRETQHSAREKDTYYQPSPQVEPESMNLKPFGKKQSKKKNYLMSAQLQEHVGEAEEEKLRNLLGKGHREKQEGSDKVATGRKEEQSPIGLLPSANDSSLYTDARGVPLQLAAIIEKIKKLPSSKIQKLEKVLQKFEDPNLSTSMLSLGSQAEKPEVPNARPLVPLSYMRESKERSKSRSRLEKQEKASSIKVSRAKRNKESRVTGQFQGEESGHRMDSSSGRVQELVLDSNLEEGVKKSIKSEAQEEGQQVHNLQLYQPARPQEEIPNSSQLSSKSGQKLIKIGKKKSTVSNITFKVLTNNGHSSFVALSSILIYDLGGELIPISQHNFKHSTPKLLKLFSHHSEGWLSNLANATLTLEAINQSVGGIRIVNFNKSELQNNKQADLIQILIDGQLHWRGQLRGGSFTEDQNYITDIKVAVRDFQFPMYHDHSLKASFGQQKFLGSSWINAKGKGSDSSQKQENEIVWLQKESISKIKELEDLDKNESKVKRIQSIRNTQLSASKGELLLPADKEGGEKEGGWPAGKIGKKEGIVETPPALKQSRSRFREGADILGELSKSTNANKKVQAEAEEPQFPKKSYNVKVERQIEAEKERQREKEKQQDEEFNEILKSLEKREKSSTDHPEQVRQGVESKKTEDRVLSKGKEPSNQSFEDFMKDSLFEDLNQLGKPLSKPALKPTPPQGPRQEVKRSDQSKKSMKNNLDDLIDELNDVVGPEGQEETGEEFTIPELPSGKELTLVLLSNWGNQQFIGLNGLQLFDSNGDLLKPSEIISSSMQSEELMGKVFKSELLTTDESQQLKLPKSKKVVLLLVFPFRFELAAVRIWNFNGHRVHNNIGIRKCHLRLDNRYIFSGQVSQGSGSSEDAYRCCESIVFTENAGILKKIGEKDWLSKQGRKNQEEHMMFKSTLEHFHRPPTRNDEEAVKREIVPLQKEPVIKVPRRMALQYEPPQLPEGFALKIILHSSWGDRFFIGLNGIEVFNEKGEVITKQHLVQILADPSSIAKLEGYEGDKRVVGNLINGQNNNTKDTDIWLAPLLSDVEKIEKGRSNVIVMDYRNCNKIAGINFYNYAKTPERGAREIEIHLDNNLLYRGYLRKYSREEGIIRTTINFTKEPGLLEAMNYCSYNEDHLEQEVGLVNEDKVIKVGTAQSQQARLSRPMTGKLLS